MFYYKLNLFNQILLGTVVKFVKKKIFKKPQWLRNIKSKKYPLWRVELFFFS